MRTVSLTKSLTAASGNCIAHAQSLAAAGAVLLNGGSVAAGVWTLDTQRRVAIQSGGNDATITATINGFREGGAGQPISEVLALTNGGTAVSVLNYLSGGTISLSGSTAGTITIGTNGTGSTNWIMPNFHMTPFEVNIVEQVSGSVTWNLETTQDTYWTTPADRNPVTPQPNVNEIIQGSTIAQQATLSAAATGYRFTITAGTGTLAAQCTQAGLTNIGR